jgi:hypothetical protein
MVLRWCSCNKYKNEKINVGWSDNRRLKHSRDKTHPGKILLYDGIVACLLLRRRTTLRNRTKNIPLVLLGPAHFDMTKSHGDIVDKKSEFL